MKRLFSLVLFGAMALLAAAAPRDEQWKKVDDAIEKGLPKTAIELLDPIIQRSLAEKKHGEAVKAIARKIVLEGHIQGNKPEEKITRLEKELETAPPEIRPLLQTLQAHWYWHYFQQNRWRFLQRTATAVAPGNDFTTWDLPRLFAEIDKKFTDALAHEAMLKQTPVREFEDVIEKGTMPETYRPTLYDFIVHEALQFYTSGEQAAAKPQDSFEVTAEDPVFDPVEKFVAWKIAATDTNSPVLKAFRVYQQLLSFHLEYSKDKSPLIDADIARLVYARNIATGEGKTRRFREALERIAEQHAGHELSALALYHLAESWRAEEELVEARKVASRGEEMFPGSVGGRKCKALISQIESKSASIRTERVWNEPWPVIEVTYRNVSAVYFRAIAYDWYRFLEQPHMQPGFLNGEQRFAIRKEPAVLKWSHKLPPTPDYKERTVEFPVPENLKPGFYYVVASYDPDFGPEDNQVSMADVWVSDLALVVRSRAGKIEGFVLHARSGEPIKGAEVEGWYMDHRQGKLVAITSMQTDENGYFDFAADRQRSYIFRARHGGHALVTQHHQQANYWRPEQPREQTILFTDRAIYRPGQSVQFKGICVRIDPNGNEYQPITDRELTVIFNDSNGKEIAQQKVRCNDYGSFSGSFTAPKDRLMGQMFIVVHGPHGMAAVQVEEYKRPKFQVTLDAPKTAPRLGEKVTLVGHAMAYTGAAIDGAQVKYRVVRQVRMPWWWGWHGWHRGRGVQQQSQEIAHGSLSTEINGTFKIEFVAKPDLSVPEKDEPTFIYQIFADVTDSAGETRSNDRTVMVGYTALQAIMSAKQWQTDEAPVSIDVSTQTLDGEAQAAEGVIRIHELTPPKAVQRAKLDSGYRPVDSGNAERMDQSDPNNWPLGKVVGEKTFTTDKEGKTTANFNLKPGAYRAVLETQDRFGKKVTGLWPLQVIRPDAKKFPIRIPHYLAQQKDSVEPGEEFLAIWGTGYDEGRAFIEVEHRNTILKRYWTKPGETQAAIRFAVTEAHRGGFTVHVTQVRENRAYLKSQRVDVPWSNKELEIKWEHFTSKLQPNQKETWTAVITGPKAEKAVAEMAATLYDESLDQFLKHRWLERFSFFHQDHSTARPQFENVPLDFSYVLGQWIETMDDVAITYWHFPSDLTENYYLYSYFDETRGVRRKKPIGVTNIPGRSGGVAMKGVRAMEMAADAAAPAFTFAAAEAAGPEQGGRGGEEPKRPDLKQFTARKNLNETAFFFPQLISDSNGVVRLTFTMPEALTQWRFLGFAHDRALRSGFMEAHTVTAKDLMVQPNPPRFLREDDEVEFTVKVSNQSDAPQRGKVQLTFLNSLTEKPVDALLGNVSNEKSFDVPAKQSQSFSWRIKVPDGLTMLTYKAVGGTDKLSDGEEGMFPVLSRRIFVTESLPLPIRGPGEKEFKFAKLLDSAKSDTIEHQALTVQMVSNPSWYAVMALPYLMEFPHQCSEQVFNRLYANALARHVANSDPKIRRVFEQWRGTPALDSPLEKNQELKSVLIEETPWYRDAQDESQARKNVGILFEENRLNNEFQRAMQQLAEMQNHDGAWPWFPGGPGNDYITLYITTGFGRLRYLGVQMDVEPALRSLARLDGWIDDTYRRILRDGDKKANNLNSTIALYLYGRSFFLQDRPVAQNHKEAVNYFLTQARKYWLDLGHRQSQGHLAIALKRFDGKDTTPMDIMKSIRERSVSTEELGMFWRDLELSWWWFRAPIETQALMIEAFAEVLNDEKAVEECKVWLLKQKQTQNWKTTKATADAVYALLLRGENLLASDALAEVQLADQKIEPKNVEAGTGFYEKRFLRADVKPEFGTVTVRKTDKGVAWGSVHWQYFEDISKVTPHEGTPLKLKKTIFKKVNTTRGPELQPAQDALEVGDELVIRVELRTDRDMEYVHMKDQRGSGVEPVNVLSQYKYQDGLGYYESTRDTASHFFIDYLPKGVYVFEYSARVQLRGEYQSGMAEIQCMYAPEFNSHSESHVLVVK